MSVEARSRANAPIVMLHVFPSFGFGGQQVRFALLANHLGDEFTHHIAPLDGNREAKSLLTAEAPVTFHDFEARKSPLISLRNIAGLQKLLQEVKPDILCTYNWGSLEAALANRFAGNIAHIHFEDGFGPDEQERQKLRRIIARRLLLGRAKVVLPSAQLEHIAKKVWRLNKKRVIKIPNGVCFERFQLAPEGFERFIRVGSIGALRKEKNFPRLIRSFIEADTEDRAKLTIVGDGPERALLNETIKEIGGDGRVALPGGTKTPEEYYRKFDIYAVSSDTEQAPLTVMEAMAAGLPIVSTNVGDIHAMVSEENRPFVTPVGDDEAFSLALMHFIKDPDARSAAGAANRKKAKEEFDAGLMIAHHRSLYREAAQR